MILYEKKEEKMKKIITGIIFFIVLLIGISFVNAYDEMLYYMPVLAKESKWRKFTFINGRNCFVNFANCFL